ncbi:macro domain-containing protein [Micromonospora matsumotoense]|uniref:type II toxin-antitoxin system antitoxin DNA ADP-ribosyl glycohydrolase DarG n=1 Tax=Micromonospora matsumotoense TaxID=121616 RepID=UPI003411A9F5
MFSSARSSTVRLVQGDLLKSRAHALVNTVNCVGVMGKGIALAFKRRYPDMYRDYVRRCDQGSVKLGIPYAYQAEDHLIINFPTKKHWRAVSRLEDIERGLIYLKDHLEAWGVTSIAVPPLGCGNGQLEWSVVGPTLHKHLKDFGIPVELYVPHGIEPSDMQLSLLDSLSPTSEADRSRPKDGGHVALVEILSRVEKEPYHWPVGRIMFQKLAYFATAAGLPTNLTYEANSYGPYASELSRVKARLQNNGLVQEQQRGQMFETRVGSTFSDAKSTYSEELEKWEPQIARVADLMARFDSRRAEIAGSVHYVSNALTERLRRTPTASEVIEGVERWKIRRKPPIQREDIARALVELATQQWITVEADESVTEVLDEFLGV